MQLPFVGLAARLGCNFDEWCQSCSIGNGESPQNKKLTYFEVLWECPGTSFGGEDFYLVWSCGSWGTLGVFDGLWPLVTHYSSSAYLSELWPMCECPCTSPERSFHVWANYLSESIGMVKSTISSCRIC